MFSRHPLRTAAIAGASAALTVALATPAHAATFDYVALGDSYASGDGAGNYLKDGTDCLRSMGSYGGVLAQDHGYALDLQACAGAVTGDMPNQYGALSAATKRVTISIGGNDVGFATVVTECGKPAWWGNCNSAIDKALGVARNELPGRLKDVYAQVRARAPHAKVVVTGYPHLFNGRDCHLLTFFSGDEMSRLNTSTDELNAILKREATAAGFEFVDVTPTFQGHAVCDNPAWIHNIRPFNIPESFHPTVDGHRAYAGAIGGRLGTAPARATASAAGGERTMVRTGAQTSSDTRRDRVGSVDLDSAEAREAAARAGVSQAEVDDLKRAIDKAQHGQRLTLKEQVALERAQG